jgi:hypothetical protein
MTGPVGSGKLDDAAAGVDNVWSIDNKGQAGESVPYAKQTSGESRERMKFDHLGGL